ncbi:MAG: SDR family oxidoreductase [Acidobacteriia bacterium]|nr:SDR family oxidoreductase [Terriglobia bacterium]
MDLGLKGKRALVVASSHGLGKAAAMELGREGARLAMCSRDPAAIERAADEIRGQTKAEILPLVADVTVSGDIERLVNETMMHFGGIDILVTNAGGPPATTFAGTPPEAWQKAFDLTLMSAVNLCRAVVPQMKQRRWGRIIFITSITVKQPAANLILSNVIRISLSGLCKSLSNEFAAENILVNSVLPGYTLTERLAELSEAQSHQRGVSKDEIIAEWEKRIPMCRLGKPEELGALIAFLASERASYITGTCIQVDGGYIEGVY